MFAADVLAAPSRSLISLERKRDRILRLAEKEKANSEQTVVQLQQIAKNIEQRSNEFQATIRILIEQMDQQLCVLGLGKFCEEEKVEIPTVSQGHTMLIKIGRMAASMYNNERRQTDDSPCFSGGRNICEAYKQGKNPIAISRDVFGYPFRRGDRVMLGSLSKQPECMAYDKKVMTVMDTLAECLEKRRDPRTGRCDPNYLIKNQIDIFYPCEKPDGEPDRCIQANAHANVFGFGKCYYDVTKL